VNVIKEQLQPNIEMHNINRWRWFIDDQINHTFSNAQRRAFYNCQSFYSLVIVYFRKGLEDEEIYGVPRLIPELSSKKVLTSELVSGLPIDKVAGSLGQDERNFVSVNFNSLLTYYYVEKFFLFLNLPLPLPYW